MKKFILIFIIILHSIFAVSEEKDFFSKVLASENGKILYDENGNLAHPFASVTKLMSAVLIIEELNKGTITLDDMVTISKNASIVGGSRVELYWGSQVKLQDLLYASLIHSANNATYALAEYVSHGDLDSFIESMNKKAKELGMINTKYYTPTGLPTNMTGKGMDVGSAIDIAKLSAHALTLPKLMEIVNMTEADINNSRKIIHIKNRNKLLSSMKNVNGLKTGHHSKAGYNIAISFIENDKEYIAIVMGSSNEKNRDNIVKNMINNFSPIRYKNEPLKNIFLADTINNTISDTNNFVTINSEYFLDNDLKLNNPIDKISLSTYGKTQLFLDNDFNLKNNQEIKITKTTLVSNSGKVIEENIDLTPPKEIIFSNTESGTNKNKLFTKNKPKKKKKIDTLKIDNSSIPNKIIKNKVVKNNILTSSSLEVNNKINLELSSNNSLITDQPEIIVIHYVDENINLGSNRRSKDLDNNDIKFLDNIEK